MTTLKPQFDMAEWERKQATSSTPLTMDQIVLQLWSTIDELRIHQQNMEGEMKEMRQSQQHMMQFFLENQRDMSHVKQGLALDFVDSVFQ